MENKLTYDWNLDDIYESEAALLKDFEKIKKLNEQYLSLKGKLTTREGLLEYFKHTCILDELESKFFSYLSLKISLDGKDERAKEIQQMAEYFYQEISPKLAFLGPEKCRNSINDLRKWKSEKAFKDYDRLIEEIIRTKKHVLDEKTNKVLSSFHSFSTSEEAFDEFDNIDIKFGKIKTEEGTKELTSALYGRLVTSRDQKIRMKAYNQLHEAYKNFNYTLSSLYISQTKINDAFVKLKRYNSELEASLSSICVSPKILDSLFEVVHKNLDLFYDFEEAKKQLLGLKNYYYFDNYATIGKLNKKYSYSEAVSLMERALEVFGEEYLETVKRATRENWIDVYEKSAKTKGGFSLGVYGFHPYILLNFEGTFSDVSTLCHEMGHTMHSYLSNKNQPYAKSNYSIFVAEVASTVNENLLNLYMLKNAKTKEEKLYFIHNFLFEFYTTVYRQTMFSEFEDFVIKSVERKEPLSAEKLNEKYAALQSLYFGKGAKASPFSKYEWSRIPHFYRPYYVFKYATGFISATIIAKNIFENKPGYLEKYLKFLSAGSSEYPLELLKSVDVDLLDPKTLQGAFEKYREYLEEFKIIAKEK